MIEKHLRNLEKYDGVKLDYYKIMPEHLHMILVLNYSNVSKADALPLHHYIQDFKSKTTMRIKKKGFIGKRFWQPNYYEHIIRNEKALDRIRQYIENNPDVAAEQISAIPWDELEKV